MPLIQISARTVAGAGLVLVLIVVFASAGIRLGAQSFPPEALFALRAAHRTAATLEALVIAALLWKAWRSRLVLAAAGLTLLLSIVGVLAGRNPPAGAALVNVLGGLALAACFALLLRGRGTKEEFSGRSGRVTNSPAFFLLLSLQVILGAIASVVIKDVWSFTLLAHALLGTALLALIAHGALRAQAPPLRFGLLLLALVVGAAGFGAALFGLAVGGTLAHAAAVALLISAASYWLSPAKRA